MGRIICAWCGKYLGEKEGIDGDTHGICPDCYEKEIGKIKTKKKEKKNGDDSAQSGDGD